MIQLSDSALITLEKFDAISQSVAARLRCDKCLVSVVSDSVLVSIGQAVNSDTKAETVRPARDLICQHTVQLGRSLMVRNVDAVEWLRSDPTIQQFGIGAYLGVPLKVEGLGVVGAICALSTSARLWSSEELAYLKEVAEFVTGKIDRDMLKFERDALSTELNEADRILALLARSRSDAVTVHDRCGAVVFVNQAVRRRVASDDQGNPEVPWPEIAEKLDGAAEMDIELSLSIDGQPPTPVRVSVTREHGGLVLCDWWFPRT